MAVVDVEMYSEEDNYFVVFHNIDTEEQKQRIKDWVNTLRGVSTNFSEYLFVNDIDNDDTDPYEDGTALGGSNLIIPDGRYAGLTIEDAYNINGHYSLSNLLLTVHKMHNATEEEIGDLYKELVEYSIRLIKDKEIDFDDFIDAYRPFIKQYTPGEGKTIDDWLKMSTAERRVAYDEIVNKMIERMLNSIQTKPST